MIYFIILGLMLPIRFRLYFDFSLATAVITIFAHYNNNDNNGSTVKLLLMAD